MIEKPNIVLVIMDTARAQSFSCYGCEDETSPFLDSVAEEGVKYERAVSQAVWTLPSHASIFTGEYQTEHGLTEPGDTFDGLDMLQDRLSENGYDNIGVVNVAFLWPNFGFDQYFDKYNYVNSNYLSAEGILDGIEKDDSKVTKLRKALGNAYSDDGVKGIASLFSYLAKEVMLLNDTGARKTNRLALENLEGQDEPFFLCLNYLEPHEPLSPPFPYSHKYLDKKLKWLSLTSMGVFSKYVRKLTTRFYDSEVETDYEELNTLRNLYKGEIEYLDGKLENLHNKIKDEYPNTVFIFTSDHGEAFGEHDHFQHYASLWDEVTGVPLIESYPDGTSGNIEYPVETRQLFDHILNLSQGNLEVIQDSGAAVSQCLSKDIEDYDQICKENMIHDFTKDTLSVEKEGEKVIRGHEEANIRISSDYTEERCDSVSEGLISKYQGLKEKFEF